MDTEGLSSKTPLTNLTTNGFEPKVMLLGGTITDESAERAVLIALYPKPALNRVAMQEVYSICHCRLDLAKSIRLAVLFPALEVGLVLFACAKAQARTPL